MNMAFDAIGALTALIAAGFWLWASLIKVPENPNIFISVLQNIGRLNAYAAFAASVSALCGMLSFLSNTALIGR